MCDFAVEAFANRDCVGLPELADEICQVVHPTRVRGWFARGQNVVMSHSTGCAQSGMELPFPAACRFGKLKA